jgi:hypothetical protein
MAGRRSDARRYAVLALYQWQVSGLSPDEVARHFFDDPDWIAAVAEGLIEDLDAGAAPSAGRYDAQCSARCSAGSPIAPTRSTTHCARWWIARCVASIQSSGRSCVLAPMSCSTARSCRSASSSTRRSKSSRSGHQSRAAPRTPLESPKRGGTMRVTRPSAKTCREISAGRLR